MRCSLCEGLSKADLKLDLEKLTEELIYAVPHNKEEVLPLVDNATEVFWERRRYGESWDDVEPPANYFTSEDKGSDMESRSKRVYKKLIFDLTAEVLRDLYREENQNDDVVAWAQFKTNRGPAVKDRTPPTTLQQLKPFVQACVLRTLRSQEEEEPAKKKKLPKFKTWGCRKKKDHVDQILVQELREEEPEWINYDDDELAVKMQLAETLFDNLLAETTQVLGDIHRKHAQKDSS